MPPKETPIRQWLATARSDLDAKTRVHIISQWSKDGLPMSGTEEFFDSECPEFIEKFLEVVTATATAEAQAGGLPNQEDGSTSNTEAASGGEAPKNQSSVLNGDQGAKSKKPKALKKAQPKFRSDGEDDGLDDEEDSDEEGEDVDDDGDDPLDSIGAEASGFAVTQRILPVGKSYLKTHKTTLSAHLRFIKDNITLSDDRTAFRLSANARQKLQSPNDMLRSLWERTEHLDWHDGCMSFADKKVCMGALASQWYGQAVRALVVANGTQSTMGMALSKEGKIQFLVTVGYWLLGREVGHGSQVGKADVSYVNHLAQTFGESDRPSSIQRSNHTKVSGSKRERSTNPPRGRTENKYVPTTTTTVTETRRCRGCEQVGHIQANCLTHPKKK